MCSDEGRFSFDDLTVMLTAVELSPPWMTIDWMSALSRAAPSRVRSKLAPLTPFKAMVTLSPSASRTEAFFLLVNGTTPLSQCHLALGLLSTLLDPAAPSRKELSTATAMFGEMGMHFWLEKAETALEAL